MDTSPTARDGAAAARPREVTREVICVLGMHRSGTSSLTGCLEEAGVHLGEVHRSSPWNEKGNRESQAIMDLHEEVLANSGGTWDRPPVDVTWDDGHRRRRDEIIASHRGEEVWGFKDPRTLVTFPLWLEALPTIKFVASFRHPHAVAASLQRRAPRRGTQEDWVHLWVDYNKRLLRLHEQHRFPVVNFDLEPDAYLRHVEAAVVRLGLRPPAGGFTFFNRSLRHIEVDHPSIASTVGRIYDALLAASR